MKIVDECMVSFPSGSDSVNPTTSPLTLFDVPWLLFPPIQPLFFFQLPPNARCSDFSFDILPRLKCSLSSALHCYFPVAGKLTSSLDNPDKLTFFTGNDCCVRLTVAHSDADFEHLCSYLPRDSGLFYQLVPSLPPISCPPISPTPLFALQITYFPPKTPNLSSSGFSIGIAYHPVLCDQRTFCSFLHTWASFCKFGQLYKSSLSLTFDRSVILDPNGLCPILWEQLNSNSKLGLSSTTTKPTDGLLRATFVMEPTDIQNAKGWIMDLCDERNRPYPVLLSPYIVCCAFVCVCLVQSSVHEYEGPMYFGFIAGGITL